MKKMLIVINPHSGSNSQTIDILKITDLFIKNGYDINLYLTQKAGELPEIIKTRGNDFDVITVSGGDGTLNEAVNGLMNAENKNLLLGYLPKGTVNDFATSLSIPKKTYKASENICIGKPKYCDIGKFNDRYFTYVAAFGAFTEVSYSTSQAKKKVLSRFAYLLDGAMSLPNIKPIHAQISVNQKTYEDEFVYAMVSNTHSVGGFKIPNISVDMHDGKFELMTVKMPKDIAQWNELILSLITQSFSSPLINIVSTDNVTFKFRSEIPWTVDGEFGGNVETAEITAVKNAIKIIVPEANCV